MFCINVVEMLENSVVEMLEKKPHKSANAF